jgi:hypothetical protein
MSQQSRSCVTGPAKRPEQAVPKFISGIGECLTSGGDRFNPKIVRLPIHLENGTVLWLDLTHDHTLQVLTTLAGTLRVQMSRGDHGR